ncbi:MAG: transcription-repair coupling factor, partial [Candidatus Limnocylindria bacterium]
RGPRLGPLLEVLGEPPAPGPLRIPGPARAAHLAGRRRTLDAGAPLVVVVETDEQAHRLADDLGAWLDEDTVAVLPERVALPLERSLPERDESAGRLEILARLGGSERHLVVVVPLAALWQRTLSVDRLRAARRRLRVGDQLPQRELVEGLMAAGYDPTPEVTGIGEVAVRGGLVDVWPPGQPDPIRIEQFGDEIDAIRVFDPTTQASRARRREVILLPAGEFSIPEPDALRAALSAQVGDLADLSETLQADLARLEAGDLGEAAETWITHLTAGPTADHLPADIHLVLTDVDQLRGRAAEADQWATERHAQLVASQELPPHWQLPYAATDTLSALFDRATERLEEGEAAEAGYAPAPALAGRAGLVGEWVRSQAAAGSRVVVATDQASRLAELLGDAPGRIGPFDALDEAPPPGSIALVHGSTAAGFDHRPSNLVLLSDRELFGATRIRRLFASKRVVTRDLLGQLEPGELVVHVDHGIARYVGMAQRTLLDTVREYLQLDFAGDDKIFLPADQVGRITRYSGAPAPGLSKLGGREWAATKRRVRQAVMDLADDLLELYSAREQAAGFAYPTDSTWQRELTESFPYTETPDQERTIQEVATDMARRRPMDRLVAGDVGYGKTEVALRAAFRVVEAGRQAAVLVPTTVHAQQHQLTFQRRLAAFPIKVEVLSRFVSKTSQARIVAELAAGTVDVVIGTHRLLSKDVSFADLGLLVVDEEQRFGVAQKEKIKQLRREVDVLTLSATPIPRTLHLSLVGIRDLSVIETAPEARLPILTRIAEDDDGLVRDAILREIDRGGQVFYVHNRVETIEAAAARVRRLVPRARVAIGHGQMAEGMLERVMLDFDAGLFDVLVCTTIIESGLDIPNANTMLIARADTFGLAQLYQLRGRVGRSDRRAYAYLLHRRGNPMSPVARRRLHAIFSASDLGAGYQIALSDLEIRGAGNILGPEQSGYMAAVGFELYTQLLAEAVDLRRGRIPPPQPAAVRLELPGSAYLPDAYVGAAGAKLEVYRRFAQVKTDADAEALRAHLLDRFGPIPSEVEGLFRAVAVRLAAEAAGVSEVRVDEGRLTLKWRRYDRTVVARALTLAGFRPVAGSNQVRLPLVRGRDPVETALKALAAVLPVGTAA